QHLRLIHSELCDLLREGSQVLQNVGVAIGLTDPILSPSSFDPDENSWRVRLMDTLEVQQRRICNEQGGYFNIRDGIFVHIYPYLLSERQKLCLVWLESIGLRGGIPIEPYPLSDECSSCFCSSFGPVAAVRTTPLNHCFQGRTEESTMIVISTIRVSDTGRSMKTLNDPWEIWSVRRSSSSITGARMNPRIIGPIGIFTFFRA